MSICILVIELFHSILLYSPIKSIYTVKEIQIYLIDNTVTPSPHSYFIYNQMCTFFKE